MSQELMTADASVPALRKPKEIVAEAKERADVLMEIVKAQGLSNRIGHREHIQIEAWQTVGRFFNCTAGVDQVDPVEVDGVKGAKAHAVVKEDRSGVVVSEAISYCMADEPTWRNKPWFQLASMAQTRAMSKALANKFRWVAVLAGFSGTPAEEMTGEEEKPMSGHLGMIPMIPMGKHTGKRLDDASVDSDWLEWAAQNLKEAKLRSAVQAEITRRQAAASQGEDAAEPGGDPAQPTAHEIFEDLEATADLADYARKWKAYLPILAGLGMKHKDRINALHARKQKELS